MFRFLIFFQRFLYRHYQKYGRKLHIRILGFIYSSLLSLFYSAYIPYTVKLGANIRFIHQFHGIFISKGTVIGDNCTIHHHVTIGSNKDPSLPYGVGDRVSPKIGNSVFIGVNVCIVGSCTIGDNCVLGAGLSIVNTNIKENSLVVPSKWRVIENYNKKM